MLIDHPIARIDFRLRIISVGVLASVAVLVAQLYNVQVKEGERYAASLRSQTTVPVILSPARGSIVDRNGIGLAENRASIDIDIYLRELVGYYARSNKSKLPKTSAPGTGASIVDVDKIVDDSTGDLVRSLGLNVKYTRKDLLRHYYQTPNIPFQLVNNLDFTTLSKFSEHSVSIPGIQETPRPVRSYNFGALAPHILGYVGKVEETTDADFVPESVGKEGIERVFDEYLQGKPGGKILRKNNVGYILGVEAVQQPTIGGTVYLSLDARIQEITEQAMRRVGRGAAVVMDPWTGDILAMVSVPSYDPNVFIPSVDANEWRRLIGDSTKPLHNRAISPYAIGSTFKTVVAMAALKNPKANFTPRTQIYSPGAIWIANRWAKDWNPDGRGSIGVIEALQWSCNTFFYQLGVRTGIDSIVDMSRTVGMDQLLLVDDQGNPILPGESAGTIPGPKWMEEREDKRFAAWAEKKKKDPSFVYPRRWRERWSEGHTVNTSIGQGFVDVTPLQLTTMIAAVANGGEVHRPRLVLAVTQMENGENKVIKEYPVHKIGEIGLDPEDMAAVKEGLRKVVAEGTGKRAAPTDPEFKAAGKTGTAQFWSTIQGVYSKDNRAWFSGYAPIDKPRYALAIVVEGGASGGGTAGPIAKEIFDRVNEMEKGSTVDMVYLTPAIGHYLGVVAAPDSGGASASNTTDPNAPMTPEDELASELDSYGTGGASRAVQEFMQRRRR